MKTPRELERISKGFANHRRIQIMLLLEKKSELSLIEIASELRINFKTAGEHTRRLSIAGLVHKHNDIHSVRHALSSTGTQVLKFLRTLELK